MQCTFNLVKKIIGQHRDLRRRTIDYSAGHMPINLSCDACLTGGSGVVWQGVSMNVGHIVAFWSGKFNSAQQNYPVHEQELLAIIESLCRFQYLLQGVHFQILTNHKGLE